MYVRTRWSWLHGVHGTFNRKHESITCIGSQATTQLAVQSVPAPPTKHTVSQVKDADLSSFSHWLGSNAGAHKWCSASMDNSAPNSIFDKSYFSIISHTSRMLCIETTHTHTGALQSILNKYEYPDEVNRMRTTQRPIAFDRFSLKLFIYLPFSSSFFPFTRVNCHLKTTHTWPHDISRNVSRLFYLFTISLACRCRSAAHFR